MKKKWLIACYENQFTSWKQTTWNSSMKVFSNIRFCVFRQKIATEIRPVLYLRTRQCHRLDPCLMPTTSKHSSTSFKFWLYFCLLLFQRAFAIPPQKLPGILPPFLYFFCYNKTKNIIVPIVVMVTLLYNPFFAVVPLLRGNSDTILTADDERWVNIAGFIVVA